VQINGLSSCQKADQRVFSAFSCRSAALFELSAAIVRCRDEIVLASYVSMQTSRHLAVCPFGSCKVSFETSSHSTSPELSQNAHSTLVFEMSRHLSSGETFQRHVYDERSVSCLDISQTFHATDDLGRSDSSVSERSSIVNCGLQSSLKLCVITTLQMPIEIRSSWRQNRRLPDIFGPPVGRILFY
jgi:hypothetical protein